MGFVLNRVSALVGVAVPVKSVDGCDYVLPDVFSGGIDGFGVVVTEYLRGSNVV